MKTKLTDKESGYASYSLDDLLKILPKEIIVDDEPFRQTILWSGSTYFVGFRNHERDQWLYQSSLCYELIDGINESIVWCLENNFI